jgi:hypothetical protein
MLRFVMVLNQKTTLICLGRCVVMLVLQTSLLVPPWLNPKHSLLARDSLETIARIGVRIGSSRLVNAVAFPTGTRQAGFMQCPACGLQHNRYSSCKKMWSDVQWNASKPVVRDGQGYVRNCCSGCSDHRGYYCTEKVQCAPPTPWTIVELRTRYEASVAWLRLNIPCVFWDHDHLSELNQTHREAIAQRNVEESLCEHKSLVKRMSYDGGVCWSDPEWEGFGVPGSWIDDNDGQSMFRFLDPGKYLYHQVFRTIWPSCMILQHYNCEHSRLHRGFFRVRLAGTQKCSGPQCIHH